MGEDTAGLEGRRVRPTGRRGMAAVIPEHGLHDRADTGSPFLGQNLLNLWSRAPMFSRLKPYVATAVVVCASLMLVACGSDANVSPNASGTVGIALTDAPFPFDFVSRADIYIVRIDGRLADTDSA